jgi:DNA replication and repair protein RecF
VRLDSLGLEGFRNLATQNLEFHPQTNFLFGPNASGKTSLLEAVHYLAIGRSFRTQQDRDVLQFGAARFALEGVSSIGPEVRRAEIRSDGLAKKLFLDRAEIDRLSAYLGWLPVVTMLLDDIRLVRGGPAERRGFLDLALSKVSRQYILALAEYRRVLAQRNRLLIQSPDDTLLRTWEDQLINTGSIVYHLRQRYLPGLLEAARQSAEELLPGRFVAFGYRSSVRSDGDLTANYRVAFESARARERLLGTTLVGPHRDDIVIRKTVGPQVEPRPPVPEPLELRRFGSEGEQRSASIALKLAEARLLRAERRTEPVFLLDEIASELDPDRSARLFRVLEREGQIFYAAAKPIPGAGRRFHVEAGEVQTA